MAKSMVKIGKEWSLLLWSLKKLIAEQQFATAATIILSLCLLRRKDEGERNGVTEVLKNWKLRGKQYREPDTPLWEAMRDLLWQRFSAHHDQIVIVLEGHQWFDVNINRHSPEIKHQVDMILCYDGYWNYYAPSQTFETYLGEGNSYTGHRDEDKIRVKREWDKVIVTSSQGVSTPGFREYDQELGLYKCTIPAKTILWNFRPDLDGRPLEDILEHGVWYDYNFQPVQVAETMTV